MIGLLEIAYIKTCHLIFKYAGISSKLIGYLICVLIKHTSTGNFKQRFNLDGITSCPYDKDN